MARTSSELDRSGNFEIWIANADGSSARQLTRDTTSSESGRVGRLVLYVSRSSQRCMEDPVGWLEATGWWRMMSFSEVRLTADVPS
jgi:hypothetical protein